MNMSRLFVRLMFTLSMTRFFEEDYVVSRKRLAAEELILHAVGIEVRRRRAGDVNPLIVGLTKNQGTYVPRSP